MTDTPTDTPTDTLTITRPDDWHLHLRQGAILAAVVGDTATRFARAMVMPNLSPPVVDVARAEAYRDEILAALPPQTDFEPLLSLYLTDNTKPREVREASAMPHIVGYKLYPAGATTHSDSGVTRISNIMAVLEQIAAHDLVLQVHGEVTDPQVDVFDREAVFIEQILMPLQRELPTLRIVLEHITTEQGVQFVKAAGDNVAATITAHHLLLTRNEMFRGGIRPHAYCLPVLKGDRHRRALCDAAASGDKSFFLGTDSAPHTRKSKESDCGCAGIYSAHAAIELYAEVFESIGALDKLEAFAAHHGADFYRRPRNAGKLRLEKKAWQVADAISVGDGNGHGDGDGDGHGDGDEIVPLRAGEMVGWSIAK